MRPPDLAQPEPVQTSGSYRAWRLGGDQPQIADLAWYSHNGHVAKDPHRLLPFTEPSIALRRRFDEMGSTSDWDFVIFGAQPGGGAYDPAPGEELFALRLAPEVMEVGLHLKAPDHLEEDCALPTRLAERMTDAARRADDGDFRGAWQAMHHALRSLSDEIERDRIGLAAALARRSSGGLAPAQLAAQVGLSARHMRRGFVDRLGLSPRAVLRRQRLTAAMLSAETSDRPGWADIAAAFGFADQAHMIRECRSLTGTSPGEWHRMRRDMSVSFNR